MGEQEVRLRRLAKEISFLMPSEGTEFRRVLKLLKEERGREEGFAPIRTGALVRFMIIAVLGAGIAFNAYAPMFTASALMTVERDWGRIGGPHWNSVLDNPCDWCSWLKH